MLVYLLKLLNDGYKRRIANPAKRSSNIPILMHDFQGREILRVLPNNQQMQLNINHLSKGIYLLRIGNEQAKVIKQ